MLPAGANILMKTNELIGKLCRPSGQVSEVRRKYQAARARGWVRSLGIGCQEPVWGKVAGSPALWLLRFEVTVGSGTAATSK